MKKHTFAGVSLVIMTAALFSISGCGQGEQQNDSGMHKSQSEPARGEWFTLFDGTNFDSWKMDKKDGWVVEGNSMMLMNGGSIWTKERFGNFVLDLELKVSPQCNSGIFFRTGSLKDPVQTGIEMQVFDSALKPYPDKHDCGAMYDLLEPSTNAMKSAGNWNHVAITCNNNLISVMMNDKKIIDMDVDTWTTPGLNPDGTKNKFKKALKDFPREGYIGFQDHGSPVWYRAVRLKKL